MSAETVRDAATLPEGARVRNGTIALIAVSLLLLGAITLALYALDQARKSVLMGVQEDAIWATYQLVNETSKLETVLLKLRVDPDAVAVDNILLRYDILISRFALLEKGYYARSFTGTSLEVSAQKGREMILGLERDFAGLNDQRDVRLLDLERMIGTLAAVRTLSEQMLLEANNAKWASAVDTRDRERVIHLLLAGGVAALAITLGAVILLLVVQLRQLRRTSHSLKNALGDNRRAADELAQARSRLDTIISSSPALTYAARASDYAPTFISPNVEQVLGYLQQDVTSNPNWWLEVLHPDDKGRVLETAAQWFQAGAHGVRQQKYRLRRADGEYIWVDDRLNAIRNARGEITEIIGSHLDVTETHNLERERAESQEQLRVARDEAVALSAARAKYVSTLSHEIRTPLNAVIGMTSVIKRMPMDRKLQDGVLTIENAAEQLLSIVNNVLDIERVTAGAMQLDIADFDLHDLVAHVMRIIGALPAARSLDVVSSVDPEVPRFLLGDQGRITQILINLMSNAVKFTERGSVRLRVSSQAEGPDRVRVRFAVQDTGKGIPRSMHEKVFGAFEQVGASSGGTGLGLTICREFAKRMGGDLTLESSEGAGSTFTFSLPLQRGLPQPANEAQRLSALHALGILDSAPESEFDELVAEAARVCDVPIALVSLMDENRQWIKAKVGLEVSQTPREQVFSAHAILTPERLMVVPDARADPRFSANPLVTADPHIRFYAAAPLVDAMGHALGTLCVLDRLPRELSAAQLAELQRLAGKVTALLTAGAARPLRVLVAEDTSASQLVIRLILEQQGHSVRVVGDGQQAVRAFAEEPFDLVLLDIQMPVMDGLEAARAMRRHERGGRDLPIVGLSAFATQKDRENAIESGMTSYLVKPVRASDIATLIAQLKVRPTTSTAPATRQRAAGGDTVDEAALRQLSDDLGPEAMAAALAQFELDARTGLERLRSRPAAEDGEPMRRTAHRLKGLFTQFGAPAAAWHSAELEQAPDALQAQAAQRLIELGPGAIAEVRAVANQMLAAEVTSVPHS